MLVKEMIQAIENKEMRVSELANRFSLSDRTIQAKIKKLGFMWNPNEKKYIFGGDDSGVFELHIEDVFKSKSSGKGNSKKGKSTDSEVSDMGNTGNIPLVIHSRLDTEKESVQLADNIDKLLAGKKEKKIYRGFYFDSDILAILDAVDSGSKSELINECLRKVFKEKKLL